MNITEGDNLLFDNFGYCFLVTFNIDALHVVI